MTRYGAFTSTVGEMLNDISGELGSLGNPRRPGQAASSSSRAEVKAEPEGAPSGRATQSDARRRSDKAKSKATAAEAGDEAKTAAEEDEETRGRSPVRTPRKTRKRSKSRTRQVSLQSATETLDLKPASETLELKPAKGKKRTRSKREEATRSRKDIIGYIDPKSVRQRRLKYEFDGQKNIRGHRQDTQSQDIDWSRG